jgi:hypothetical protein
MVGIGPEWVHLRQNGKTSNSVAAELAADFMFWPSDRHHFGWFLEPAYDYSFAAGHPAVDWDERRFADRYSATLVDRITQWAI